MSEKERALLKLDEKVLWHPFTPIPHKGPQRIFVKGEGAYLIDSYGKKYLDATSSWWCNIHGHCHPKLVKAIQKQAATLDQILMAPHTHPAAVELADRLLEKLGKPISRIFYSDDGSTAVEAALKMSVQYWYNIGKPLKKYFLSVEGGYHGDTLGAVGVSHLSEFKHFFEKTLTSAYASTEPYCYHCSLKLEHPQCQMACLKNARELITNHKDHIAAMIVEPLVLGAGGMITYPKEYLEELVSLCKANDILVIFDEVFTGFGRTGSFFAMDQCKSKPDIICLSKGLTAGMLPAAVTAVTEAVFDSFRGEDNTFYHGHTFTGNPITCALALESLKIFEEENVIENNQKLSAIMAKQRDRFLGLPHVGDIRHLGMIWAVELVLDKKKRTIPEPANGPCWRICTSLWEKGIWMRPLDNMLYIVPPYCITEAELEGLFDTLYDELHEPHHFLD